MSGEKIGRPKSRPCEMCGEMIAVPVPRQGGAFICEDCFGEREPYSVKPGRSDKAAGTDSRYHGGPQE